MRSYLLLFFGAFCVSFLLTPFVRSLALSCGVVDHPDDQRRIHRKITPRWGGIAIYLSFLLTLLWATYLKTRVGESLSHESSNLISVLAPATLIFLLGVWDDWRGLSAPLKFGIQIAAAIMLYASGWRIQTLSLPFDGHWDLPGLLGLPITIIWVLLITNAFNLIDGIDGLATGASSFALLSLFICALLAGNGLVALMSLVLLGAALGFLPFNFNPATIFLGDSGSLLLGFMAAALSLISAQKSSTMIAIAIPLVSFGLPITEVSLSVIRRHLNGVPLFTGDRGHIHHKLLDRGLSQRQAVILLYGVCAAFTFFGILLLSSHISVIVLVFFILGVGLTVGVQRLGYDEINEFGAQLKSEIMRQPQALRGKIQLRQRCRQLQTATTLDDLLYGLQCICQSSQCEKVQLEVFQPESAQRAFLVRHPAVKVNKSLHSLAWTWQWLREPEIEKDDLSYLAWSLRLPIINEAKRAVGALTLFGDPQKIDQISNLVQLGENLQRELGPVLSSLNHQTASKAIKNQLSNDPSQELLIQEA